MTKTLTIAELRKMQETDLLREITAQHAEVARLRHAISAGAEKNSHYLRNAKRTLAVMFTVLTELRHPSIRPSTGALAPARDSLRARIPANVLSRT